jgi:hypothetical protein
MRALLSFAFILSLTFAAAAQTPFTDNPGEFFGKAMKEINPRHSNWILKTAEKVVDKNADALEGMAMSYMAEGNIGYNSVQPVALLLMMQCAANAEAASKIAEGRLTALHKQRQQYEAIIPLLNNKRNPPGRQLLDSLHRLSRITQQLRLQATNPRAANKPVSTDSVKVATTAKPGATEIDAAVQLAKAELGLLKEASEVTALRLQELTDKRSNIAVAAGNLQRQITETAESVIVNLK